MKVVGFAASNSKKSINKTLVEYLANKIDGHDVEVLDLNDYELPLYSADFESENGVPENANKFLQKINQADALVISFAEHNGTYTAAFKNLFDWASRVEKNVYQDKPTLLLSTSPGPRGAQSVLEQADKQAPRFGAKVIGSVSVPSFMESFDIDKGQFKDTALELEILDLLDLLIN